MSKAMIDYTQIDEELMQEAEKVYKELGIDLTTAFRIFLRASIREQGLPIRPGIGRDHEKSTDGREQEIFTVTAYSGSIFDDDEAIVEIMPLRNRQIPPEMYVQLIRKIPKGKVSCMENITAYLEKLYGLKADDYPDLSYARMMFSKPPVPVWRVVSRHGVLFETMFCSREAQKESLERDGVPIVQRGNIEGSYKVENYKDYMFDFSALKAIRISC